MVVECAEPNIDPNPRSQPTSDMESASAWNQHQTWTLYTTADDPLPAL